jgi:predicted transcriptional regulator of viral defense system
MRVAYAYYINCIDLSHMPPFRPYATPEKGKVHQTGDLISRLGLSHAQAFRVLQRWQQEGFVVRIGRGLYQLAEDNEHQNPWLAAQHLVPNGVMCLVSALAFHQLGTQSPPAVWMAVASNAWRKQSDYPPLEWVHMGKEALSSGVEVHTFDGGELRVFSIEKTIADCFKFRNRVGLDVALEALRDAWASGRLDLTELDAMAKICRVQKILKPYIEAFIA